MIARVLLNYLSNNIVLTAFLSNFSRVVSACLASQTPPLIEIGSRTYVRTYGSGSGYGGYSSPPYVRLRSQKGEESG